MLCLGAQYEAFNVWGEYVRKHGNLQEEQAKNLVQVVIDGWIVLQVARRIDPGAAAGGISAVDHQGAQRKAKQSALDALDQISELDAEKLIRLYDQFLSYRPG